MAEVGNMKPVAITFVVVLLAVIAFAIFGGGNSSNNRGAGDPNDHILHVNTPDIGYLHYSVRILNRSVGEALTFDPNEGRSATISYKLTRDGDIRLRVTRRDRKELVLRTLLDWTHQEFGPHEVEWDGKDASGNIVDNKGCFIDFAGDDPRHKEHEQAKCHELNLTVLSPAGDAISKLSDVRLKLTGDRAYGPENGYELRTYVDYEPFGTAHLEKETVEFTLPDVGTLSAGSHLITVNVEDGQDHIGAAGIRVNVEP